MATRPNTVADFASIKLAPGSGRAIDESLSWEEFGDLGRNVWNEAFAMRIPGQDKCILDYSCGEDWTTPTFFAVPRLTEFDIRVIAPWTEVAEPGVTSVTLSRTPWSDDDIVVYLSDKTMLPSTSWSRSGRVMTIPLDETRATYIEYLPKITAFLTSKSHSKNEWSSKVTWNMQFKEK
jgi:hypothetical protein